MALRLRPYQAQGIDFLADRGRACLYDEPGVGKSMQALLAMRDSVPQGRILVIGTGDSIGVWQDEVTKWLDEPFDVVSGVGADPSAFESGSDVVITNYSRLPLALSQKWGGVIFDESQMLRNRNTRTLFKEVKAAFGNRKRGFYGVPVFFTSGTPVVKAAGDLWPMLWVIDKHRRGSYWDFVWEYANTWEDDYGWQVEGVKNVQKMWDELEDVVLRRLKKDVQPELPPKIRQRIPLYMTPKQAKAYREIESSLMTEVDVPSARSSGSHLLLTPSVLAREMRLRQLLVTPRLLGIDENGAGLDSIIAAAESSSRPFVVYTPFAESLEILEAQITKASSRPIYRVRGGMGAKLHQSVNLFKLAAANGEAPILLSSVQSAKSWSVSSVTYECTMLGVDWNDTTMTQAEDRLARDGQLDTVLAHYLVHYDTHDYEALEVLAGKRRLANVILDRLIQRSFGKRKAARAAQNH